ncbi:MAG TPA: DUF6582 domain-containing protein [Candidatus Binataceae bacterium]|nr:DUF6582 domain-containing protein [Candidatus Binataceae bacterium]
MAELSARQRARLHPKSFALPKARKYPIQDRAHARAALARVAQFGTAREKAQVRAAVRRRFPSIQQRPRSKKES